MMVDHSERKHAICSASGAHRWLHCPPSALLETQFPDTTSEAAKEGTLAHEICEAKLRNYFFTKEFSKRKLTNRLKKLSADPLYQKEMDGHTDAYVDFIKQAALSFEHQPAVLIEQKLDLSSIIPDGFGTADCILISGSVIHVIDFKYGKGVPVETEGNPQMLIYAWGAYYRYSLLYPIDTVRVSIVQPRLDIFSTAEYDLDTVRTFSDYVSHQAALAVKGEGEFKAGDWCRFCRARKTCRARAEENVKLAGFTERKPPLITNMEVGEYLRMGKDVARWLSDLEDYALSECLAGREVDGWKAVEGRSRRDWVDQEKAFAAIIDTGMPKEMLYETSPLSLAKIEKLMGKKDFSATVGDLIEKSPGKPTLVPESDKRPAISNNVTAKEVFKKEN